ncbi:MULTISPECIES: hypothetical protein [unclassified Mannheimia]|uniref:hypothetical protein n=1 Tax=unclassified Mannheimia TaxID=2645054 RepID=UPI00359E38E8
MAKKSSFSKSIRQISRAIVQINRINERERKERERRIRLNQKAQERSIREAEREQRSLERQLAIAEKNRERLEKQKLREQKEFIKTFIYEAKCDYNFRCLERKDLVNSFINEIIK